jgi:hypothetical protein
MQGTATTTFRKIGKWVVGDCGEEEIETTALATKSPMSLHVALALIIAPLPQDQLTVPTPT